LSRLILFGEGSLKRALTEFVEHFHAERPHQGKANVLLFPTQGLRQTAGAKITCKQRLGGCFDTIVAPHEFLDPTGYQLTVPWFATTLRWRGVPRNHASSTTMRSWLFGVLIAERAKAARDPELLAVSATCTISG
jgi:hypothetical protein